MKPFDAAFPDLARRDTRQIETIDPAGKPMGTLLFREYYCDLPRCDCRRVVIAVSWLEGDKVVATLNYQFDKHPGELQLSLVFEAPQSEASPQVRAMFADMVAEPAYRKRLHAHYAMWKRTVDDPSHPQHAQACDVKPRRKRARKPRPQAAPASQQALQRLATSGTRSDSKIQQRFARLVKKVEQQRQQVQSWQDARPAISRELAANDALFATHRQLGRDLVHLLDRAHADPGLAKAERKRLQVVICEHAWELLLAEPNDELKVIYNRHSHGDFDREHAHDNAIDAYAMKSELEDTLGLDLDDADLSSVETLEAHVQEVLRGMEQEAAEADVRRKQTPKQQAKEFRREAERQQVGKALQEIYRKLAVALHPDLERDPIERERKTLLMQQVNAAYEAKDLLQLLELQLRFEQVDPGKLDAIAEDRLKRYNTILEEQSQQLAAELLEREVPFRLELDLPPPARIVPSQVIGHLRETAVDARQRIAALRTELVQLANLTHLKAWLRPPPRSRRDAWDDNAYG